MILSALNDYYYRLLDGRASGVAPYGYSGEKISYVLLLSKDGCLVDVLDVRDTSKGKPRAKMITVPQPEKRTSGIKPNFLWDKSSYVLGVSGRADERALAEHEAFVKLHKGWLAAAQSPGLKAVMSFLEKWKPEQFESSGHFTEAMLDANFVFRLEDDQLYSHEYPEAVAMRSRMREEGAGSAARCLVTGVEQPIARLHPAIKGVREAQSSGASIVSFNLDSACSYGKVQGDNAPVSEQATFAYTTALNHLLRADDNNRQRLQIGDATVVFWARAAESASAQAAENLFSNLLEPPSATVATDESESAKLQSALEVVRQGRPLAELDPYLSESTEIFVLGLAPNQSRLSIRFWERGSLELFATRLAGHYEDLRLEPSAWHTEPAIWRLALETVPNREGNKRRSDDIQPHLAGELTRSILTGGRYPRSLLANLIARMRADGNISNLRVAMCKAVLAREQRLGLKTEQKEIPVSLDTSNNDPGYLLGRLFAVLENLQASAIQSVNATIKDRYFGSASAAPASVFPVLLRNAQHHVAKIRKDRKNLAGFLENQIAEIIAGLEGDFPRNFTIESQGRFAIGYYHQRKARFQKPDQEQSNDQDKDA